MVRNPKGSLASQTLEDNLLRPAVEMYHLRGECQGKQSVWVGERYRSGVRGSCEDKGSERNSKSTRCRTVRAHADIVIVS